MTGQLLRRTFGALEDGGDVRERHAKHAMQDERDALVGAERVEHLDVLVRRKPTCCSDNLSLTPGRSSG